MKNTTPHESYEQQCLVAKLNELYPGILMDINPAAGMLLTVKMAARVKLLGYQAGTPDIFLPEYKIYLELKRIEGGKLSPAQKSRLEKLKKAGYIVIVAKGAVDALNQIQEAMKCYHQKD